jgi:hypothetical protein
LRGNRSYMIKRDKGKKDNVSVLEKKELRTKFRPRPDKKKQK